MSSRPVKWVVTSDFGSSTIEIDIESGVVLIAPESADAGFYVSFEGLEDFVEALEEAHYTVKEMVAEEEDGDEEEFF